MGRHILRGERLPLALAIATSTLSAVYGQTSGTATCSVLSSPVQVRLEGLTERAGDITFQCSGTPQTVISGTLTIFLPVNITNRVNASNQALDANLLVNYGSGFAPSGLPGVIVNNGITFANYSFTIPASGNLSLQVSGIRAAMNGVATSPGQPVIALISANSLSLRQAQAPVAFPQPGLYATLYDKGVTCTGSPLPSTISMANLFSAKTIFFSTRLTEGFGYSFLPRGTGEDSGTRFLVNYSGFPAGTQLYVPDFVAGSDAATPTAGGDLGPTQSPGQYIPGSGTLLLARVQNADATGAGGSPLALPAGSGALDLNSANPVMLANGSGYVVYEVVDSNNIRLESAQFPTFIGISNVTAPATANETVSLAPVSTAIAASQSAPVPRFVASVPSSDCAVVGDCQAGYLPKLSVSASAIQLTATAGGSMTSLPGYIPINNTGGGIMNWTATISYQSGSGWLSLDYDSGQNGGSVRLFAKPGALAAGTYTASVTIDAGPMAGSVSVPVTLTVSPAVLTPGSTTPTGSTGSTAPGIAVTAVVNAATFAQAPAVAGSLATLMGANLSGKNVSVTFDGTPASLLYFSPTQINLQVPASLAGKGSASMVVTVDGNSSAPVTVQLSPAWPSIFNPGVLNQDYSVNAAAAPAKAGSVVQIYGTGIPDDAEVWASIGGPEHITPLYAGPAPGLAGVQQVNVAVPAGISGAKTTLYLCAAVKGQQYCSNTYELAVR